MLKLQLFASVLQCVAVCCSVLQCVAGMASCESLPLWSKRGTGDVWCFFTACMHIQSALLMPQIWNNTLQNASTRRNTLCMCLKSGNTLHMFTCTQIANVKGGLHLVMTKGIFWISDFSPMDTDDFTSMAPWTCRWRDKGDSLSVRM